MGPELKRLTSLDKGPIHLNRNTSKYLTCHGAEKSVYFLSNSPVG